MSVAVHTDVSEKELKKRNFILTENMWKVVIVITLPLFLFQCLNYVNSVVDTLMCANISQESVSASASLSQVTNMVSAIGSGLASGGSILIAREIGKKNYNRAHELSCTVFSLIVLISLIICALVIPLARPLLRMMGVLQELIDIGANYFIVLLISSCLTMINTVYLGIQKARGSTLMISLLNVGVIAIKITLTSIFVYVVKVDDMTYVALATLCANACLTIFVIVRMLSKSYIFHYVLKMVDLSKKTNKKIAFISFPIFLGRAIFSLGKVVINGMAGQYGQVVVGSLGVSNNMGGMVTNGLSSMEDSESSIISQNIGAGNTSRALKCFYCGLIINLAIAVIGVSIVSIPAVNSAIVSIFATDKNGNFDQEFFNTISEIFFYEKMGIITLGINSSVLGLLYGLGMTKISMVINVMRVFAFRIPSLFILQHWDGLLYSIVKPGHEYQAVGLSMGFSNICIGIVAICVAIYIVVSIKRKEKIKEANKVISEEKRRDVEEFLDSFYSDFAHYHPDGRFCYEDGVINSGAYQMYLATKDKKWLNFVIDYYDKNIGENGEMACYKKEDYNIDNVQCGTALMHLEKIHHEEKYVKALDILMDQVRDMPRTKSGSFWHKQRYPYQIWLDGLFMGMPFYALNAEKEHSLKEKKDIIDQFKNVDEFNFDPEKKVYMHCYDETKSMQWADKTSGRSPNVWLRSVGWLAMAACDVYEALSSSLDVVYREYLKKFLKKVLESMEPYQDPKTKCFYDLPLLKDAKGNYLETSGSVMLAYGYLKGARLGMLKFEESKKGVEILEGVIENFVTKYGLFNICQVSGLDNERRNGSVEYYLSEKVVCNDSKGVGPFTMAYAEYLMNIK